MDPIIVVIGKREEALTLIHANGRPTSRDAFRGALTVVNGGTFDRTVDNAVVRPRKHLSPGAIKTIRSVGYQLGVPAKARRLNWHASD